MGWDGQWNTHASVEGQVDIPWNIPLSHGTVGWDGQFTAFLDIYVKGISFDKILDGVRDSIGSSLDRSHLVTKQDLYNIKKSYNIRKIERHKDDAAMSVHLCVQECIVERNNPILLYKDNV